MMFENPAAECDVRVSVRIGEQARSKRGQQQIHTDDHEPWHGGLRVHHPTGATNDLL